MRTKRNAARRTSVGCRGLWRGAALCGGILVVAAVAFAAGRLLKNDKNALIYDEQGRVVGIRALQQEEAASYGFGDSGDEVASIQQRLRDYGYYDEEPTGFYGTQTVHAVSAFKAANGLDADGAADALTCELLDGDNATARAVYERMLADEETASRRGTSLVTALTYAPDALAGSAQVEVWDEKSESYVELADGQTYDPNALIPHSEETVAAETVVNTGDPNNLKLGDENERVAEIQTRLSELGYYAAASVTNYYGTMTQTAIYNFQKANGMMPDGVCGTATQNLLFSGSAVTFGDYLAAGGLEYSARDEVINQLIAYSKNYIGCPYVWAGAGPRVFDCSGYTMYIFRHFGYSFGHGCSVQSNALGAQLSMSELLPGDLVFFDTNGGHNSLEHVGIYIGNGQFIHASSGGGRVMINSLTSGYYCGNFMWGKRVIPL